HQLLRRQQSLFFFFFFSSRRRHTRSDRDWSSDVCSSDLQVRRRHWRFPHQRCRRPSRSRADSAASVPPSTPPVAARAAEWRVPRSEERRVGKEGGSGGGGCW